MRRLFASVWPRGAQFTHRKAIRIPQRTTLSLLELPSLPRLSPLVARLSLLYVGEWTCPCLLVTRVKRRFGTPGEGMLRLFHGTDMKGLGRCECRANEGW